MNSLSNKLLIVAGIFMLSACSAPTTDKVTIALKPVMPQNYVVKSVEKCAGINGLYEVVVEIANQPTILYMDSKLKHIVSGSIVEIATKKNYTYETQMKLKPTTAPQAAVTPVQSPTTQNTK